MQISSGSFFHLFMYLFLLLFFFFFFCFCPFIPNLQSQRVLIFICYASEIRTTMSCRRLNETVHCFLHITIRTELYNNMSTSAFRSGKNTLFFECDLLNRESIEHLFSTIASKVPSGIDILVNNAGKLTEQSILRLFFSPSLRYVVYNNVIRYILIFFSYQMI